MKLKFLERKKESAEKTKKSKPKKKKVVIIVASALLILIIALILLNSFGNKKVGETIQTAFADIGDIELTISGTGTIEANEQYEVMSLVKGEIISSPFEEGQIVEKGDLLYEIDTTDIENNIERSKISLEKTQKTYNKNLKELSKLTVTAPISGNITALYVENGDSVGSGTKIADIVNTDKMILTVPFIDEHVSEYLYVGQNISVNLQNTNDIINGTVTKIVTGNYINASGVAVRNVEITVNNPGAIKEGDKATAMTNDVACNDLGTFKNYGTKTVTAEVSGTISYFPYSEGDKISEGETLAKLESETILDSIESNELSLRESQLSLENTYNELDNYNIKSPITGTVIQKTSKQGDTLDNTNNSVAMAVIADMSKILFTMSIDELDISKVEEGQTVAITADALPDTEFSGYVESVSIVGTSQNGVTTYPITVVVNEPEGLIPGMNVSAVVTIEKRENVVRVPISAVRRGNVVAVKGEVKKEANDEQKSTMPARGEMPEGFTPPEDGELPEGFTPPDISNNEENKSENNSENKTENKKMPMIGGGIPEGFTAVPVKTGINDDTYIEIISGINEGDEVWVTSTATSTGTTQNGMPAMGGGMPMGGSMPMGGGMPSGGMSGGGMRR